jgi:hypothetical protein
MAWDPLYLCKMHGLFMYLLRSMEASMLPRTCPFVSIGRGITTLHINTHKKPYSIKAPSANDAGLQWPGTHRGTHWFFGLGVHGYNTPLLLTGGFLRSLW